MGLKGLKTAIRSVRSMELEAGQESAVVELTKTSSECKESHLPPQTVPGWGTGVGRGRAYGYPETGSILQCRHGQLTRLSHVSDIFFQQLILDFFCLKIKKIKEYFHDERDQDCPLLSLLIMCHKPSRHRVWRKEQLGLRTQFIAPSVLIHVDTEKGTFLK